MVIDNLDHPRLKRSMPRKQMDMAKTQRFDKETMQIIEQVKKTDAEAKKIEQDLLKSIAGKETETVLTKIVRKGIISIGRGPELRLWRKDPMSLPKKIPVEPEWSINDPKVSAGPSIVFERIGQPGSYKWKVMNQGSNTLRVPGTLIRVRTEKTESGFKPGEYVFEEDTTFMLDELTFRLKLTEDKSVLVIGISGNNIEEIQPQYMQKQPVKVTAVPAILPSTPEEPVRSETPVVLDDH